MLKISQNECTHDYIAVTYGNVSMGAFFLLRWGQIEKKQMVQLSFANCEYIVIIVPQ